MARAEETMLWIARIVGLVLLMGSAGPASASEALPDAPTVQVEGKPLLPPLEAHAFRKTRTPYWVGLGLLLGGAPVLAVGYFGAIISCMYGCDGYPAVVWVLLGTGAGASVVGQFLMVSSAFSNTRYLRQNGFRASSALAVAAAITPFIMITAGAFMVRSANGAIAYSGLAVAALGYISPMVLSGAQLGVNRRIAVGTWRPALSVAPTFGRSPGVVVSLAW